jgi:hypothetical protein
MCAGDTWIIEHQIGGRGTANRQPAVERHALAPGQHQIEVHLAVSWGAAEAATRIGPVHLAVADRA